MYFPFFVLHDWGKRSAEARSPHCAVLPYNNHFAIFARLWYIQPERISRGEVP